jgi:hypothetical protein
MRKLEADAEELAELVEEALRRLAGDPGAAHLWQWSPRPGCDDEPTGPSRRSHLTTLLKLMGAAAVPGAVSACGCADDPCLAGDASTEPGPDNLEDAASDVPADHEPEGCADDPCLCGDDPCPCGDDPCACGDDPC